MADPGDASEPYIPIVLDSDVEYARALLRQIEGAMSRALDRQVAKDLAERMAPARVFEGCDGSVWMLTADPAPGVELRGWPLWP